MWKREVTAKGYGVSLWGDDILKLILAVVSQLRESSKNHQLVQLKWANVIVRELCLDKSIIEEQICAAPVYLTAPHAALLGADLSPAPPGTVYWDLSGIKRQRKRFRAQ